MGTKLLTPLHQNTSMQISYHIHEWRRHQRLIRAPITDQLLADWITKYLFPPIARDVSMGGVVIEEKAISRTQYLDLVYSQFETLYDLIPQAPRPNTDSTKPPTETPVDGVVDSIQPSLVANPTKQHSTSTTTLSTPTVSTEVNAIQSTQTPSNKKKGKGKNKKPRNQQENPKDIARENDNKGKRKAKYPYLFCGGYHFTKYFPRHE